MPITTLPKTTQPSLPKLDGHQERDDDHRLAPPTALLVAKVYTIVGFNFPLFLCSQAKLTSDHLCRPKFWSLPCAGKCWAIGWVPVDGTRDAPPVAHAQNHPSIGLHCGYNLYHGHVFAATTIDRCCQRPACPHCHRWWYLLQERAIIGTAACQIADGISQATNPWDGRRQGGSIPRWPFFFKIFF